MESEGEKRVGYQRAHVTESRTELYDKAGIAARSI